MKGDADNGKATLDNGQLTAIRSDATDNGQWSLTRESTIINLLNLFIMLKYSLIECFDPITNEVMSFECITPVTPEDMQDVYFETKEEIFYIDSLWDFINNAE